MLGILTLDLLQEFEKKTLIWIWALPLVNIPMLAGY